MKYNIAFFRLRDTKINKDAWCLTSSLQQRLWTTISRKLDKKSHGFMQFPQPRGVMLGVTGYGMQENKKSKYKCRTHYEISYDREFIYRKWTSLLLVLLNRPLRSSLKQSNGAESSLLRHSCVGLRQLGCVVFRKAAIFPHHIRLLQSTIGVCILLYGENPLCNFSFLFHFIF